MYLNYIVNRLVFDFHSQMLVAQKWYYSILCIACIPMCKCACVARCMGLRGLWAWRGVRELAPLLTAAVNISQTIGKKAATAALRASEHHGVAQWGVYGSEINKAPPRMPFWGWHDLVRFLPLGHTEVFMPGHTPDSCAGRQIGQLGTERRETAHYELVRLHFNSLTQTIWEIIKNQISCDLKG